MRRKTWSMIFALLFIFSAVILPAIFIVFAAGEAGPLSATPIVDTEKAMLLYSNVGLSGVFLLFLLWSLRRQESIEVINKRYEQLSAMHVDAFKTMNAGSHEAFRQINERNTAAFDRVMSVYQKLNEESQRVAIMTVKNNERILTILEGVGESIKAWSHKGGN